MTTQAREAFGDLVTWCRQERKVLKIVSKEELTAIAKSDHHEGIAVLSESKAIPEFSDVIATLPKKHATVLALCGVQNPHNIGAILRIAAFYAVDCVVVENASPLSGATMRVAEGGAESITLATTDDMKKTVKDLARAGFAACATTPHTKTTIYQVPWPARTVFIFGNEKEGLTHDLLEAAELKVAIPARGAMESLNVATSVAVILGERYRTSA